MPTLLLGLFASTNHLADRLRDHRTDEVIERGAGHLLTGEAPLPLTDDAVVIVTSPTAAAQQAAQDATVSDGVAIGAWEAATRAGLRDLEGREVVVVDASRLEEAAALLAEAFGLDPGDVEPDLAADGARAATAAAAPTAADAANRLHDALRRIVGRHQHLPPADLPPPSPMLDVLAEEFVVAMGTRRRDAELFDRSVTALAGLTQRRELLVRAPDPYEPSYGLDAAQDVIGYRAWLQNHDLVRNREQAVILDELAHMTHAPTLAVVVPVYRPDLDFLSRCVESVTSQSYAHWELCLCDDSSGDKSLDRMLAQLERTSNIRVARRTSNGGISAATNDAARLARADFLVFADQDDELATGALAYLAKAIIDHPQADVIYTDEDKLDPTGGRREPHFKPDWSPDLLLSQMYIGHLLVVRRTLFEGLGGLRSEYDGSQDFDLALRATEEAREVVHVPRVAYHWRQLEGSSALDYRAKPYADVAARAAITDALRRRSEDAVVEDGLCEGTFRVRRSIPDPPLVSVVIPFRDGSELLRKCVDSLHTTAGYDHWEALLVDNRSWEPETVALTQQLGLDPRCRLLEYDNDFNWSAINNWATEQASGDILLFLNSDVEGGRDGWLAALVEHAQRREVGVVGARLLYPHETVQHAGVVLGMGGGVAWHAFCHLPADAPGYFAQAKVIRNYSAVTGACMMMRRSVFEEAGGFDESLAVGFSDVDLCLNVRARGLSLVYTPFAELIHYESATRGRSQFEAMETVELFARWGDQIRNDPYFNPNLDIRRTAFGVAPGAEEVDKWRHVLSLAERSLSDSGMRSV